MGVRDDEGLISILVNGSIIHIIIGNNGKINEITNLRLGSMMPEIRYGI